MEYGKPACKMKNRTKGIIIAIAAILIWNHLPYRYSNEKTPSEVHTQRGPQKQMWKSAGRLPGAVCPLPQGTP